MSNSCAAGSTSVAASTYTACSGAYACRSGTCVAVRFNMHGVASNSCEAYIDLA